MCHGSPPVPPTYQIWNLSVPKRTRISRCRWPWNQSLGSKTGICKLLGDVHPSLYTISGINQDGKTTALNCYRFKAVVQLLLDIKNINCLSTQTAPLLGFYRTGAAISRQQELKHTLVTTKVWISEHATQQALIFLFFPLRREEMTTRFSTTRAPSASPFTPRRTRPGSAGRSSSMTPHLNADALGLWCGCRMLLNCS